QQVVLTVTATAQATLGDTTQATLTAGASDDLHSQPLTVRVTGAFGSLDTSWGDDGIAYADVDSGLSTTGPARLQPDGKLVVLALARDAHPVLARFDTTGKLDTGFAQVGYQRYAPPPAHDTLRLGDLALQPDGRIVLGGYTSASGRERPAAMRVLADAALDLSFGSGGYAEDT